MDKERELQLNQMMEEASKLVFGENKDYDKAIEIANKIIEEYAVELENDPKNELYNYDSILDFIIHSSIYKPKKEKAVWVKYPIGYAYNLLAYCYNEKKDFENALKAIEKNKQWMPMNMSAYYEEVEIYKMQKNYDKALELIKENYARCYDHKSLARYYRDLGFCYIEKDKLDLAYALYTVSLFFEKSKAAINEMDYINSKLNRKEYEMTQEEITSLLSSENIQVGIKEENLNSLMTILENAEKNNLPNEALMELFNRLFILIKDPAFNPYIEVKNDKTFTSVLIPRVWEVKKTDNPDISLECITDKGRKIIGNVLSESTDGTLTSYIEEIHKNAEETGAKVLFEQQVDFKIDSGNKKVFAYGLIENVSAKEEKSLNLVLIVNGYVEKFKIELAEDADLSSGDKLYGCREASDIMNMLHTLFEFKKEGK